MTQSMLDAALEATIKQEEGKGYPSLSQHPNENELSDVSSSDSSSDSDSDSDEEERSRLEILKSQRALLLKRKRKRRRESKNQDADMNDIKKPKPRKEKKAKPVPPPLFHTHAPTLSDVNRWSSGFCNATRDAQSLGDLLCKGASMQPLERKQRLALAKKESLLPAEALECFIPCVQFPNTTFRDCLESNPSLCAVLFEKRATALERACATKPIDIVAALFSSPPSL